MKLNKIKFSNLDIVRMASMVLINHGYSVNNYLVPIMENNYLVGYMVYDYDANNNVISRYFDLSNLFKLVKEYFSYYEYNVSHIDFFMEDSNIIFNVYLFPLDYNKMVLKKRG